MVGGKAATLQRAADREQGRDPLPDRAADLLGGAGPDVARGDTRSRKTQTLIGSKSTWESDISVVAMPIDVWVME